MQTRHTYTTKTIKQGAKKIRSRAFSQPVSTRGCTRVGEPKETRVAGDALVALPGFEASSAVLEPTEHAAVQFTSTRGLLLFIQMHTLQSTSDAR